MSEATERLLDEDGLVSLISWNMADVGCSVVETSAKIAT